MRTPWRQGGLEEDPGGTAAVLPRQGGPDAYTGCPGGGEVHGVRALASAPPRAGPEARHT